MHSLCLFVAIDHCILPRRKSLIGQLPGLVIRFVTHAQAVILQIDRCVARVIQLHPRIWKLVQVIHDTIDVRLHQFINQNLGTNTVHWQPANDDYNIDDTFLYHVGIEMVEFKRCKGTKKY